LVEAGVIYNMTDLEKLISLKDQLLELQAKLKAIGDYSLSVIKGCEDIAHSSARAPKITAIRDQAIEINYLAHETFSSLRSVESNPKSRD
jgi:hypothetical protein